MTGHCVEELLWHMRPLSENAATEWERKFAADMAKRGHWKNWKPSKKQMQIMRRLVRDAFGQSDGIRLTDDTPMSRQEKGASLPSKRSCRCGTRHLRVTQSSFGIGRTCRRSVRIITTGKSNGLSCEAIPRNAGQMGGPSIRTIRPTSNTIPTLSSGVGGGGWIKKGAGSGTGEGAFLRTVSKLNRKSHSREKDPKDSGKSHFNGCANVLRAPRQSNHRER